MLKEPANQTLETRDDVTYEQIINGLKQKLGTMDPTKPEYGTILTNLQRLETIQNGNNAKKKKKKKSHKKKRTFRTGVDPNVAFQVFGFLAGTVLCIHAEQVGNITTKAFSFVPRIMTTWRV